MRFKWAVKERIVQQTEVCGARVSTVFIGLDHNLAEEGPPLLYETMVFGGELDASEERYATWDEAEAGHARWVEAVRAAEGNP